MMLTPRELAARLAAQPGLATVRALIAAMEGDPDWSVVSATTGGRLVWAEFTHLPSGTILTLTRDDMRDEAPDSAVTRENGALGRPTGGTDDAQAD